MLLKMLMVYTLASLPPGGGISYFSELWEMPKFYMYTNDLHVFDRQYRGVYLYCDGVGPVIIKNYMFYDLFNRIQVFCEKGTVYYQPF